MKPDRLTHSPFPLRIGAFLLLLALLWLPFVGLAYWLLDDPNTISLTVMPLLFIEFFALLRWWGNRVYRQSNLIQRYGLVISRQNGWDWLEGLAFGFVSLFALFVVQGWLGFLEWQPFTLQTVRFAIEGFLIATGVGLGEELIFRGWLLDELERDYRRSIALWTDSILFACLHFIRPIAEMIRTAPQFPGLLLLGLTLVWAKRSKQGRLGVAIGLHAGLVWGYYIVNVGQLVQYSQRVPEWVTGIDRNPLAGGMGLLFLGILAVYWRGRSHSSRSNPS